MIVFHRPHLPPLSGAVRNAGAALFSGWGGAELVFAICEAKQVEVVIPNKGEDTSFEEDLAKDVLEIITVFSARLYGSRSRKNQKLLEGIKAAVEASQC